MSKENNNISRRKMLAATGSGLAIALAGCGSNNSENNTTSTPTQTETPLPENGRLWIPIQNKALERYNKQLVQGKQSGTNFWANILLYKDLSVEKQVQKLTMGEFSQSPARVIGTIYIQTGGLTSFVVPYMTGTVEKKLSERFLSQLKDFGVKNINQKENSDYSREYSGSLPLENMTISSKHLPGDKDITINPHPVPIDAGFDIKVGKNNNLYGFVWIQPLGTYRLDIPSVSITGSLNEGIDVDPSLTLHFDEYKSLTKIELQRKTKSIKPQNL